MQFWDILLTSFPHLSAVFFNRRLTGKGSFPSKCLFKYNLKIPLPCKYFCQYMAENVPLLILLISSRCLKRRPRDILTLTAAVNNSVRPSRISCSYPAASENYFMERYTFRNSCIAGCNKHLNSVLYQCVSILCLRGSLLKTEER